MISAGEWAIMMLSLRIAVVACCVSLPLAVWLGWALARRRSVLLGILDVIAHVPLVLPPVVTGYVLLLLFGRSGPLGMLLEQSFGVGFAFRWTGAALAAGVMAFPLMLRAIRLAFEAVPQGLEEAAQMLGAPRWAVFLRVTLPLALPGLIAGVVLGFAKALGEFGATITFVAAIPGQTETLPAAIYLALQVPGGEAEAARLAGLSLLLAIGALALSEGLTRRARARREGR